jgi:F0F1-type ATP synthase epsilon subunit
MQWKPLTQGAFQCASQHCSRVGRDGHPRSARTVNRTTQTRPSGDHRGERGQQAILSYVYPWNTDLLAGAELMHDHSVSGGFAIVQPNSQLSINAVEGFPIEDFSEEAVKSQLSESQKIASGSGSEQDIAEAKIEIEVSLRVNSF